MADTFTCDNCGNTFPREEMKEVFRDGTEGVEPEKLCASCLDQKMNEAEEVYGVEGQEKRRAAYLARSPNDTPDRAATGRRE